MAQARMSRRLFSVLFVASGVAGLVAACGSVGSSDLSSANPSVAFTVSSERTALAEKQQSFDLAIHASNMHMDPSAFTLPVGRPVRLVYTNDDTVLHRLAIPNLPATVNGQQNTEVVFAVDPGKTVTTEFTPQQAGTYNLECALPGHQDAGMIAKVFVTGGDATPTAIPATAVASAATATPMTMEGGHAMAPATAQGQAHAAHDATVPPIPDGAVKKVQFTTTDKNVDIAPGVTLSAWTFDGDIPGPVVHVRQGDTVEFTLTNNSVMAHSIDFHAARTAPSVNYRNVNPGQSFTFTWKANDPGIFMYHCGTAPILAHLAEGMYGAVIVDPANTPLPAVDREFVFVQSEYYLTAPQNGVVGADLQKAKTGIADYVVFNGYANQYSEHPISVKVDEKIRVYLVNAGPNHFSAFHVVGTILDHVWVDGNPANDLKGIQTWTVAPGEGSAFDFTLSEAGNYPMVTHSFSDANDGAVVVFKAE